MGHFLAGTDSRSGRPGHERAFRFRQLDNGASDGQGFGLCGCLVSSRCGVFLVGSGGGLVGNGGEKTGRVEDFGWCVGWLRAPDGGVQVEGVAVEVDDGTSGNGDGAVVDRDVGGFVGATGDMAKRSVDTEGFILDVVVSK